MKRRETKRLKRGETMRGGDGVFIYPLTEIQELRRPSYDFDLYDTLRHLPPYYYDGPH